MGPAADAGGTDLTSAIHRDPDCLQLTNLASYLTSKNSIAFNFQVPPTRARMKTAVPA